MLTPAVVHALVAAGATAAMLAAAFEADFNERANSRIPSETVEASGGQKINPPRFDEAGVGQRRAVGVDGVVGDLSSSGTLATPRNVDATLHATDATFSTASRPLTATERSRNYRAKLKATRTQRDHVSTGVAPLHSLSNQISLSLVAADEAVNFGDIVIPLPRGFQPDDKTMAIMIKEVEEPYVLLENFKEHYEHRPRDRRTMAAWQATLRKWARSEHKRRNGPAQLALMRPMKGGWNGPERRRESG